MTGCSEWVPVRAADLSSELAMRPKEDVLVQSGDQELRVKRGTACHIGDTEVLSGNVQGDGFAPLAEGCECRRPPCTQLDVSHAVVSVRRPGDRGVRAAVIIAGSVLGGIAVFGAVAALIHAEGTGGGFNGSGIGF